MTVQPLIKIEYYSLGFNQTYENWNKPSNATLKMEAVSRSFFVELLQNLCHGSLNAGIYLRNRYEKRVDILDLPLWERAQGVYIISMTTLLLFACYLQINPQENSNFSSTTSGFLQYGGLFVIYKINELLKPSSLKNGPQNISYQKLLANIKNFRNNPLKASYAATLYGFSNYVKYALGLIAVQNTWVLYNAFTTQRSYRATTNTQFISNINQIKLPLNHPSKCPKINNPDSSLDEKTSNILFNRMKCVPPAFDIFEINDHRNTAGLPPSPDKIQKDSFCPMIMSIFNDLYEKVKPDVNPSQENEAHYATSKLHAAYNTLRSYYCE